MESVWSKDVKFEKFNKLEENIKTDVLIIGGGMCGILCAYMLSKEGVDCVLAEADEICKGITDYTTAKVTVQHGLIYNKIITKYGTQKASMYYESQKSAFDTIKAIASESNNFKVCNSYVYSLNNRAVIEKEVAALEKIGVNAAFYEHTELPFSVAGAVMLGEQGIFHPLKFVCCLVKKLKIYEHTKIIEIRNNTAITGNGTIKANKIIVATHFPFINKYGGYFLKMYQYRSYVLALENAENIKHMYVDEAENGLSFRRHNNLLLLGGGGHRTGGKGGNWTELRRVAKKYYPDSSEIAKWATQDCMTLDFIPYIGRYSAHANDLYVATGFNKWGMTSSMVSAMVLTDMVCGRKNKYEELYSPSRSVYHYQLVVNIAETFKGMLAPTVPRCPHMGCALKYNKSEHSWDCPCHGSRFHENGKLINNPATRDKNM